MRGVRSRCWPTSSRPMTTTADCSSRSRRARPRLLAIEAGGKYVALELLRRRSEIVLRAAVLREELLGDAVDVDVGRLRREHHRDEQLEWIPETQRDLRIVVLERETLDDRAY